MQIMITHDVSARIRVLQLSRWQLALLALGLLFALMLSSGAVYHWFFLKAARDGWPVVSAVVKWVVRDEIAQRDRFMRENLDAIAQKVGEVQAKLVRLEAVSERVSGLAGVKPEELQGLQQPASGGAPSGGGRGGAGGPGGSGGRSDPSGQAAPMGGRGGAYFPLHSPTLEELHRTVTDLDGLSDQHADVFTLIESRLFEERMRRLMVPSTTPVVGPVGSGFGFRADPITGRMALHTGLDFPAEPGTPIRAAAGGVVLEVGVHPEYGQTLEMDHGNRLSTLYAHLSRSLVKPGDIVRRGQVIAEVGNTGRSTGPHLHFEVLLQGVPQNPARFLGAEPAPWEAAARKALRSDLRGGPVVK
jgi:murein DD-endopeptidase MepM/ murein hydrolase activator NlpD